mmetsp:Transcript_106214/g.331335  ORF Transcript_106214/g.331335 Transcript_106214/m.331335 type:complete len:209 (-) Transcript_106214:37-663(-)
MPDVAAETAGGKVFMVSSLDPAHPAENILDGSNGTYWISTGLYPQEILLNLGRPAKVSSVRLYSTRVRSVRFEGCQEDKPVNFNVLAECEVEDAQDGRLQVREMPCGQQEKPTEFVRLLILSGWDDFCSVHRIQVDGVAASSSPMRRGRSKMISSPSNAAGPGGSGGIEEEPGSPGLKVEIPDHAPKEGNEPDAPRKPDHMSPWEGPG